MVAMYVRDWAEALAWYRDKLGFVVVYREDDHAFAVLGLPGGGAALHLVGDADREPGGNRCVPNISIDDFDAVVRELGVRGVQILSLQDDDEDGYRLATIVDLEGNQLNLYAFSAAPPTTV
jgi:catechol 2,3-dioxygenase-like lactoylglutathione lyase family enzyme